MIVETAGLHTDKDLAPARFWVRAVFDYKVSGTSGLFDGGCFHGALPLRFA
jgi:hypothetical protein